MTHNINRRTMVIGGLTALTACSKPAQSVGVFRDNDRPIVSGPGADGANISCDNASVLQSSVTDRIVQPTDFTSLPSCKMTPDSFEGPYYTCVKPRGKAIAGERQGQPLLVALQVTDEKCQPVENAIVDIWSCDAEGYYSAFTASPDELATSGTNVAPQTNERFCRGTLATDKDGIAEFATIYPGYYAGRAIHIHYKIHVGNKAFITNQALFPEVSNSQVLEQSPYSKERGTRRIMNAEEADGGFDQFAILERGDDMLALLRVSHDFG
ncbi:MAG: hypothetical protein AAGK17_13915 [Pseudomonadota bacterium]